MGAALAGRGVETVLNPDYADGMSSSIAAGIGAAPAGADGYLIALGDMPAVAAGTVSLLCRAFEAAEPAAIAVPVHDGRRGHPVLFGRATVRNCSTCPGTSAPAACSPATRAGWSR